MGPTVQTPSPSQIWVQASKLCPEMDPSVQLQPPRIQQCPQPMRQCVTYGAKRPTLSSLMGPRILLLPSTDIWVQESTSVPVHTIYIWVQGSKLCLPAEYGYKRPTLPLQMSNGAPDLSVQKSNSGAALDGSRTMGPRAN